MTEQLSTMEHSRAQEIARLHEEIAGHLRTSLGKAIRIGQLLTEQKAQLQHGNFLPWVKENLPFTDRTARNYMRLYENRKVLKVENVSSLSGAYMLLGERTHPDLTASLPDDLRQGMEELHCITQMTIRCARKRQEEIANIADPFEAIEAQQELVGLLLRAVQDRAELLLYAEAKVGELSGVT